MNQKNLFKALTTSAFVAMAFASVGTANATAISGNFGAGGYAVINFNVTSLSTVDFQSTGNPYDPTFSLFDGSGVHLITADDSNSSTAAHLTQNLGAGNYSLLVSQCCNWTSYLPITSTTDGFNAGSYYTYTGTATLAGLQSYLDANVNGAGYAYSLNISDNANIGAVPVPAAAWLLGSGLLGLIGVARRKTA